MRAGRGSRAALVLPLLAAGCAGVFAENPAGGEGRRGGYVPVPVPRPAGLIESRYKVLAGDTVYGIARANALTPRALIDANGLLAPFRLAVGQSLIIPAARFHIVVAGDTLYSISRRYRTDMPGLIRLNDLEAPYIIKTGEAIRLPVPGQPERRPVGDVTVHRETPSGPAAAGAVASAPLAPPAAVAGAGGTAVGGSAAGGVAGSPSAPVPAGASLPPLAPPVTIEPGPAVSSATTPPPPAAEHEAPEAPVAAIPVVPPAAGAFAWPVQGRVLSGFGPKANGLTNDGINIAAAKGTPVRAAATGIVAYAGNELRGFGNLILVRHADGWISAYAHLDGLTVKRGQQVAAGQVIGQVGQTGAVSQPQLHFELRKGQEAVDPKTILGPLLASYETGLPKLPARS